MEIMLFYILLVYKVWFRIFGWLIWCPNHAHNVVSCDELFGIVVWDFGHFGIGFCMHDKEDRCYSRSS